MAMVMKSDTLRAAVDIVNVPSYAHMLPYIVARKDEREYKFWFYGAWEDKAEAERVADELGDDAFVFDNDAVKGE